MDGRSAGSNLSSPGGELPTPTLMPDRATSRPMSDSDDTLERRLAAVERAIGGEPTPNGADRCLGDSPRGDDDELERRLSTLEARVDELDAAVQAIRGFLGGVSAVNESVERRADAAVAAVDRLERCLDDAGGADSAGGGGETDIRDAVEVDTDDGSEIQEDDAAVIDHGSSDGESPSIDPAPVDDADERSLRDRLRDLP